MDAIPAPVQDRVMHMTRLFRLEQAHGRILLLAHLLTLRADLAEVPLIHRPLDDRAASFGLAKLTGFEVSDMRRACAVPHPLRLLGLLLPWHVPSSLAARLEGSGVLRSLLQDWDGGMSSLMAHLQQPAMPLRVVGERRSRIAWEFGLDGPLAAAHVGASRGLPLRTDDIAVLFSWFTGMRVTAARCTGCEGDLGFDELQIHIQVAAAHRYLAGFPVKPARLLHAIRTRTG